MMLYGFFLPISTAATNGMAGLAFLCLILAGGWSGHWATLRQQPVAWAGAGAFLLLGLGWLHADAPLAETARVLAKYRELLYLPLILLIFREQTWREWGINSFLSAMLLVLSASWLAEWGWIESREPDEENNPVVFKNHITQSTLMAFAAYILAWRAWREGIGPGWRVGYLSLAALAAHNILFMIQGRTGYLVLAALGLLLIYQKLGRRGLLWGILLGLILAGGLYSTSERLQQRVNEVATGWQDYQQGSMSGSIAMRLSFLENSWRLFLHHPWLGSGTGDFAHDYRQLAEREHLLFTSNPHNEYLLLGIQLGIIGLLLLPGLLGLMWYQAYRLPPERAAQVQALVVVMAVACLFNSLLMDFTEAHFFVYFAGLLFAGVFPETEDRGLRTED